MKIVLSCVLGLILCGCAINRVEVSKGEETFRVVSWALWPASSQLNKQKITSGKWISVGTEGLEQSGGGTNIVEVLKALDSILGKIKP